MTSPQSESASRRYFAENAFRLLELPLYAYGSAAREAAQRILVGITLGTDDPRWMVGLGTPTRTAEQVRRAAEELADPAKAAIHALFFPWVEELPDSSEPLRQTIEVLTEAFSSTQSPEALASGLARRLLPEVAPPPPRPDLGIRLFPGDLDVGEVLGPPPPAETDSPLLGRAPALIGGAVLGALRSKKGPNLEASYFRGVLAAADSGHAGSLSLLSEAETWRRFPGREGSLLVTWKDFLLGRKVSPETWEALSASPEVHATDRALVSVLAARQLAATEPSRALDLVQGLDDPGAAGVRGVIALSRGDEAAALRELEAAGRSATFLQTRLRIPLALARLAAGNLDGAEGALRGAPMSRGNFLLAQAQCQHRRSQAHLALATYRTLLDSRPGIAGAVWGMAALATDPAERRRYRIQLLPHVRGTRLAAELGPQALFDGDLKEIACWNDALRRVSGVQPVKAALLDRLGRRSAARRLVTTPVIAARKQAAELLQEGRAHEANACLVGIPFTDSLRSRAGRAIVLSAREARAGELAVERCLGRLLAAEKAALHLPGELLAAIHALEQGSTRDGAEALQRHASEHRDRRAEQLLHMLEASSRKQAWEKLGIWLTGIAGEPRPIDLPALLLRKPPVDDAVRDVALIVAAAQSLLLDLSPVSAASEGAHVAASILRAQAALRTKTWADCESALLQLSAGHQTQFPASRRAAGLAAALDYRAARVRRPDSVRAALEAVGQTTPEHLHDRALWEHQRLLGSSQRSAPELVALVAAWDRARAAFALHHPTQTSRPRDVERALVVVLAELIGAEPPGAAAGLRVALLAQETSLGIQVLEQLGWIRPRPRRSL